MYIPCDTNDDWHSSLFKQAYNENMAKIQEKLKANISKQSLNSLEKLSDQLAVDTEDNEALTNNDDPAIDASETIDPKQARGENKVTVSRKNRRKTKFTLKSGETKPPEGRGRRQPRFFCQF